MASMFCVFFTSFTEEVRQHRTKHGLLHPQCGRVHRDLLHTFRRGRHVYLDGDRRILLQDVQRGGIDFAAVCITFSGIRQACAELLLDRRDPCAGWPCIHLRLEGTCSTDVHRRRLHFCSEAATLLPHQPLHGIPDDGRCLRELLHLRSIALILR